jgi:hypothetical protein
MCCRCGELVCTTGRRGEMRHSENEHEDKRSTQQQIVRSRIRYEADLVDQTLQFRPKETRARSSYAYPLSARKGFRKAWSQEPARRASPR